MADQKSPADPDYAIGYGRPPKATRFRAGKSGNPKGRPKGTRSVAGILNGILQQKIAVTEGGKTRRMATLEVMLRRLVNDAMRSEPQAMKLLLALVDRYATAQEPAVRPGDLLAEDRAILAQYLQGAEGWMQEETSTPVVRGARDGL